MTKTLDEYLENERLFENERLAPHEAFSNKDVIAYIRHAAAEILRVAEEWVNTQTHHAPDHPFDRGYYEGAQNLATFLKSYINPAVPTRNDKEGGE